MSNVFEDYKVKIESISSEMKVVQRENDMLKTETETLEAILNDMRQKEKNSNIIVSQVPREDNKNINQVVQKIMGSLNINIDQDEILELYRIGSRKDAPILVKLKKEGKNRNI
ncbi:hypothetical protein WA026_020966 [Henosepilachna vigintioctopunctata]|uniref:Uncharacterized protein n=1 Tax=Henosepilachna vigintioctopunctata TaxID=420089 RepID=A0AAW1VG83_9CUCU